MLTELRIRNFAVVEDVTVPLEPGLNAVTGETGAGKSIVVGALHLLLGGRASAAVVRSGCPRAVVEGVAEVGDRTDIADALDALGLEADDGRLAFRREVSAGGRSRGWVNGSPASAGALRRLGALLVDIHGQHEHARLLSPDFQRKILDAFGACGTSADGVAAAFRQAARLRERLVEREARSRALQERAELTRFQAEEIGAAKLRAGEEEELRAEAKRLSNAGLLARETGALHQSLFAGEGAVTDRLADAVQRLRRLGETDSSLSPVAEALDDAYHGVAEAAADLGRYSQDVEHDPSRLDAVQQRQAVLHELKRKYGGSVEAAIEKGRALTRELAEIDSATQDAGALAKELKAADAAWRAEAEALSARRRKAADRLRDQAQRLFPGLGLDGGRFEVRLEPLSEPSPRGLEAVRFMASMNPGFPVMPLAEIASGGELSRVMLALKSVLAEIDLVPTLVFDEVDAGIGGAVAAQVGDRLGAVARGRQVIVVTHLARVASRASSHLLVEKQVAGGETTVSLRRLAFPQRVREIARMLGGDPDSASSVRHARELLERR